MQEIKEKLNEARALITECLSEINKKSPTKIKMGDSQKNREKDIILGDINFTLNPRAFFKRYSRNLSGAKNFTLVVAYLTKGKVGSKITFGEITACWDKNRVLLGAKKLTTRIYGTRGKENDWLSTNEQGSYELTPNWKKIFD